MTCRTPHDRDGHLPSTGPRGPGALAGALALALTLFATAATAAETLLLDPDPTDGTRFGHAVDTFGDDLVVARLPYRDPSPPGWSILRPGSITVYRRVGDGWQPRHHVESGYRDGGFGADVAIHGTGSRSASPGALRAVRGAGRVPGRGPDPRAPERDLVGGVDLVSTDLRGFGESVDLGENLLAVGAPGDGDVGAVLVYELRDGRWVHVGRHESTSHIGLGSIVRASGDRIAAADRESGHVAILRRTGGGTLVLEDEIPAGEAIHSLALHEDSLVIGGATTETVQEHRLRGDGRWWPAARIAAPTTSPCMADRWPSTTMPSGRCSRWAGSRRSPSTAGSGTGGSRS